MPNLRWGRPIVGASALTLVSLATAASAQPVPTLTRLAVIGCGACDGPQAFTEIIDLDVTPAGVVWVADADDPRLRAFGRDGRPLRAVGRGGQGPGEYAGIARILAFADGAIAVVDHRARRLSRLDSLGRFQSAVMLGAFPFDAARGRAATVYILASRFAPGSSFVLRSEAAADLAHRVPLSLASFPAGDSHVGPQSIAVAPGGRLAIADGKDDYLIRIYEPGGSYSDLRREIPRVQRSAQEVADLRRRASARAERVEREAGAAGAKRSIIPRQIDVPQFKPHLAWSGLRYDDGGRLWVKTMRGDERRTVFDLFDEGLAYVGEIVVPGEVRRFAIAGSYLATSATDGDDLPQVTLWRIDE